MKRGKLARFTEDVMVVLGGHEGPSNIRVPRMFGPPSKAIKPVHRIERYWPSVRVRMFFAAETGVVWMSPGYHTLSLPRFAIAKARSWWRHWREPVPHARVVRR